MPGHPPRALSVVRHDPGWRPDCFEIGRRLKISVNGIDQLKVVAYDVDAGWVRRYECDENGRPILNRDGAGAMVETVTGDVEVRWRCGPATRDNL